MNAALQNSLSLLGRIFLASIFLMSAIGNKIPNFTATVELMKAEGVPAAAVMLSGAICFLILGSVSVITGFFIRAGTILLIVFLILATYFFHDFWNFSGPEQQTQLVQLMKNLALMGSLLFLFANGAGRASLAGRFLKNTCNNQT